MACAFCATGRLGPGRTLTIGELIEQFMAVVRPAPAGAGRTRPTHIVFMGMGEPLLEPRPVIETIRVLTWEHGFGYAARRITVSTCGIPAGIRALAEAGLRVRLAFSLNAPWEGLRTSLMPNAPPLADVIPALRHYAEATRTIVTLEYVLLGGVNDTAACARALSALASRLPSKINLIVYNETEGTMFRAPSGDRIRTFLSILLPASPTVTMRQSLGGDIAAACGQLAGGPEARVVAGP
jgi:23S rRNA (adenine2503-C2)-methyltransferase